MIIHTETLANAPVDKVWGAYTSPEHITGWNFASDDWCCPSASNDLRPGGRYVARMEAKDGSFGFDFEAVYDEVIHHQKLAYTMGDGRKATVVFEAISGTQTRVSVDFEAETMNPEEMQRQGWQAILDNFGRYAEALI
jgi:uncharacterized protein YndB with AHSA1/START domain